MEFRDVVRTRRMVRTYDRNHSIPREQVDELLQLAVRAPSAGHTQGWRFLVCADITSCERFWTATTGPGSPSGDAGEPDPWLRGMRTAPVLIVCLADRQAYLDRYAEPDKGWTDRSAERWPIPYWYVDVGMAAHTLLLGACDAGLGGCFFGVPGERWDELRAAFAIPDRLDPVGVVSLGRPAPDRRSPSLRRGRRPLTDVVSYGSFD